MTTSKKSVQRDMAPAGLQATRQQLAREHSARHSALLGIARWTSGNSYIQMEIASTLMPTSKVKWHDQAQKDFKAWLTEGGFAGPGSPATRPADSPAPSEPTQLRDPTQRVLTE